MSDTVGDLIVDGHKTETLPVTPAPYARTKQVATTVKPRELEELDATAFRLEVSRAELIYRYLREGLARDK
jgi:hypothetical protein